jgi:hypothetical protein
LPGGVAAALGLSHSTSFRQSDGLSPRGPTDRTLEFDEQRYRLLEQSAHVRVAKPPSPIPTDPVPGCPAARYTTLFLSRRPARNVFTPPLLRSRISSRPETGTPKLPTAPIPRHAMSAPTPTPADVIAKKRDGLTLDEADIATFVRGATDGSWADYQLSALLMAIYLRGMSATERGTLTLAMMRSGALADLSHIPGLKVDKHSTGGVGDNPERKTSYLDS